MGIDLDRFVSRINDELICSICQMVLENPLQIVECEHAFCSECINQWMSTGNETCPVDRNNINKEKLRTPRIINKFLCELKIKCDYESEGCKDNVELEHLSQHCKQCKFNPNNKSTNSNHEMSVRKKEFINHNYDEELKLALEMSKVTFENENKRNSVLKRSKFI